MWKVLVPRVGVRIDIRCGQGRDVVKAIRTVRQTIDVDNGENGQDSGKDGAEGSCDSGNAIWRLW